MRRLLPEIVSISLICTVAIPKPIFGQILPPAKRAEHVKIIQGPDLEVALDNQAIVRWTSTNPGGDDDHNAVAHYGTDRRNLGRTAKSHIRLNRYHPETIFRVRLLGL